MARKKTTRKKIPKKKAVKKKARRRIGGPFLAAAVFCESIIEDKDGVLSAMQIVDTVQIMLAPGAPSNVPNHDHPVSFSQSFLLSLKTGDAHGKYHLELVFHSPTGEKKEVGQYEINLAPPPHGGVNVSAKMTLKLEAAGLYLLEVKLNGRQLTCAPLNVVVHQTKSKTLATAKKKSTVKRLD